MVRNPQSEVSEKGKDERLLIWSDFEESERLSKRFSGVNQTQFGIKNGISPAMISHNLALRRPISLEGAMAYARGFGVPLEEISPRLTRLVMEAYELTGQGMSRNLLQEDMGMTRREMKNISVEIGATGNVTLTQALFDMNEHDPCIELTCEQTPLVAGWLLEAAGESARNRNDEDDRSIPVRYFARGPEAEAEQLQVFCNDQGMVILKIDDNAFIELAPAMAKRLREQLSVAIRGSLTDLLRPDADV